MYVLRQREGSPLLIQTSANGVVIVNFIGTTSLPERRRTTAE